MNGFFGDGPVTCRIDRFAAELLELPTALLPVNRHEREDEVGLVELDAFGVDADEDLRDLLLVAVGAELDDLEAEVAEVADTVDALLERVLVVVGERLVARLARAAA